jgi:hypothetical protein
MAKIKKGQKLVCVPCGREVVVSNLGVAKTTIWCCGTPMKPKAKVVSKKKKSSKK